MDRNEVIRSWKRGRIEGTVFEDGSRHIDYNEPSEFDGRKPTVRYTKHIGVEEITRRFLEERKSEIFTLEELYYISGANNRITFREYKKRMKIAAFKKTIVKNTYREEGTRMMKETKRTLWENKNVFAVLADEAGTVYYADKSFKIGGS